MSNVSMGGGDYGSRYQHPHRKTKPSEISKDQGVSFPKPTLADTNQRIRLATRGTASILRNRNRDRLPDAGSGTNSGGSLSPPPEDLPQTLAGRVRKELNSESKPRRHHRRQGSGKTLESIEPKRPSSLKSSSRSTNRPVYSRHNPPPEADYKEPSNIVGRDTEKSAQLTEDILKKLGPRERKVGFSDVDEVRNIREKVSLLAGPTKTSPTKPLSKVRTIPEGLLSTFANAIDTHTAGKLNSAIIHGAQSHQQREMEESPKRRPDDGSVPLSKRESKNKIRDIETMPIEDAQNFIKDAAGRTLRSSHNELSSLPTIESKIEKFKEDFASNLGSEISNTFNMPSALFDLEDAVLAIINNDDVNQALEEYFRP